MELREYVKIIASRLWLLITVVIVATLGTFIFIYTQPGSYDASASIDVIKKQDNSVKEYQYDDYYAIQASSLFADTMISWLKDPSNVSQIYTNAQLELPTLKLKNVANLIKPKKIDPAAITITLNDKEEKNVKSLIYSTINFVKNKVQMLSDSGEIKGFTVSYSEPLIVKYQKPILSNTAIAFMVSLILGIGLVFLVEYFNPKVKK